MEYGNEKMSKKAENPLFFRLVFVKHTTKYHKSGDVSSKKIA